MTANEIRNSFLKFFESKGHAIVPSAPMVIKDDPTLMFTNAGMNQWKDIILGTRNPEPRRRADSQKCLRVSGKHNDLEEVGHDTYHHTMFEMLGNWSFGDYFKEGAIDMAWEYLVDVLKLNPEDLYVTVFEGSKEEGLERDDEAAQYWLKHVPADHIINGNKHDNFWEMGDTGPCGPCSEIHIDNRLPEERGGVKGRDLVNKDNPQVIEIWNIVFMQYERKADGHLEPLSMNVIDTGMGFERLVRVIQGKHSNYDTDVFQPIIKAIGDMSGLQYGEKQETDVAMRVVADHLRTIAFSIADGQLPGNAKAGYVIRRILRRAVRYAYTFLGQKEAFMYRLLPVLIHEMGATYPELQAQKELISKVMKEEEDSFLRTLETGIRLLEGVMQETKASGSEVIPGAKAFTLFDTYGFPLDLTELICHENGLTVDEEGFNTEMQKQKERARNAAVVENDDWVELQPGDVTFVGWDHTEYECRILRYRRVVQKKQTFYQIVLDKTPFYAEMGGQVGDRGVLVSETETIEVIDTKRENGLPVHITKQIPQDPKAPFMACVDTDLRHACEANHTCTHLLDQALREVLGEHVEQKGSLVTPEGLRFDFSHFQKVTNEELRRVEQIVNARIREDIPLQDHRDMPIDEAKKLGAIALFGEKYGDKVRVVQFGQSVEFCGGCHASSTGRLGMFKIISESSVAAGVRRVEAITGAQVENLLYSLIDTASELRSIFNNAPDLRAAVQKTLAENSELHGQLSDLMRERTAQIKEQLKEKAKEINGLTVVKGYVVLPAEFVKDMAFQIRAELPNSIVVLGSENDGKPLLTAAASDSAVASGVNIGKSIREAAKLIQGGGGGQPHFATAGGRHLEGLTAAVDKLVELLTE
ncbi:MAG: alanine--tRNA ligase [Bacteroidaceae bacterium]|nr:alanine--tRNA ligase [Paraprevotella sp.]MDY2716579.1 alanine--tRNA ligase [Bacteroidaceae bacterium]